MHRSLHNSIKGFYGISDRVALLKISSRYVDMCLLQVYAPTSESSDEELEQFYSQLEEGMKQCKSNELPVAKLEVLPVLPSRTKIFQ